MCLGFGIFIIFITGQSIIQNSTSSITSKKPQNEAIICCCEDLHLRFDRALDLPLLNYIAKA